MNSTTAIRQGLAANLAVFLADGWQVTPYMFAAPASPGFQVMPERVDFHQTLQDGMEVRRFIVFGHVPLTTDEEAQDKLDALLDDQQDISDPLSVRQALEADQHLTSRLDRNGTLTHGQPAAAEDVTVTLFSDYAPVGLQGGQQIVLAGRWTVEVRT